MSIAGNASTQGIPTEIYYPLPLHPQPAFAYRATSALHFREAENAGFQVLGIAHPPPMKEQMEIARALFRFHHN